MIKLKIGIDIDGTITKASIVSDVIKHSYREDFKYEDIVEYDLRKVLGISQEDVEEIFNLHEKDLITEPILNDNALEVIKGWSAKGYEIIIVTARKKIQESKTKVWLEGIGLPYNKLYVLGGYDKTGVVESEGLDIFIEDRRETILSVEDKVPETINVLIDTPYNQGAIGKQSKRLFNWYEIEDYVSEVLCEEDTREKQISGW